MSKFGDNEKLKQEIIKVERNSQLSKIMKKSIIDSLIKNYESKKPKTKVKKKK